MAGQEEEGEEEEEEEGRVGATGGPVMLWLNLPRGSEEGWREGGGGGVISTCGMYQLLPGMAACHSWTGRGVVMTG